MKKYKLMLGSAMIAGLVALVVYAQYTPLSKEMLNSGAAVPINTTGDITSSGDVIYTAASQTSVTNAQAVTLTARVNILTGTGGANNTTNTITLANPGTQGILRTVMCSRASTNLFLLDETDSNLDLSSDAIMDNLDSVTLYAETTTNWVEVSQVDN